MTPLEVIGLVASLLGIYEFLSRLFKKTFPYYINILPKMGLLKKIFLSYQTDLPVKKNLSWCQFDTLQLVR